MSYYTKFNGPLEFNMDVLKTNVSSCTENLQSPEENHDKQEVDEVLRDLNNLVKKYVEYIKRDLVDNCIEYKKAMLDASKNCKTNFRREYIIPYDEAFMHVLYKKSYLFLGICARYQRSAENVTKAIKIYSQTHLKQQYEKIHYINVEDSKYYHSEIVIERCDWDNEGLKTWRRVIYDFPIFIGEIHNKPRQLEKTYLICHKTSGFMGWKYYCDLLYYRSKTCSKGEMIENYNRLITLPIFIKSELKRPEFMKNIQNIYENIRPKIHSVECVSNTPTFYKIVVEFNW